MRQGGRKQPISSTSMFETYNSVYAWLKIETEIQNIIASGYTTERKCDGEMWST